MASASSKKSTASCRSAARNTEATCLAVCPTQRDSSSEYRTTSSLLVERVGQRLGADGLAGAGRAGEMEGQARGRCECRSASPHWRKIRSCFRTSARAWLSARSVGSGQHHVVERALGLDRLDQLARPGRRRRDRGWNRPCAKDRAPAPGAALFADLAAARHLASAARPPVTRSHASRTAALISSQADGPALVAGSAPTRSADRARHRPSSAPGCAARTRSRSGRPDGSGRSSPGPARTAGC